MAKTPDTSLQKILVASDSRDALVQAVERAAAIEHYTGAAVTALLVSYDPAAEILVEHRDRDTSARIMHELVARDRENLEAALASVREHIAELDCDVVISRDAAAAICAAARERNADLIVKPLTRSAHLVDFLHAPLDWKLMREAPCPVLFTRAGGWQTPTRVLATLDVMDAEHRELNEEILRTASLLTQTLGGELHVATAFPALAPYVSQYQIAQDLSSIEVQLRNGRTEALKRLLHDLDIEVTAIHVEEGRPRDVIRALAVQLAVGLCVVGTAGRSGLAKLLLGNTAEQIVSDLPTDLLTVRAFRRPQKR
jgi:universal stress protein E